MQFLDTLVGGIRLRLLRLSFLGPLVLLRCLRIHTMTSRLCFMMFNVGSDFLVRQVFRRLLRPVLMSLTFRLVTGNDLLFLRRRRVFLRSSPVGRHFRRLLLLMMLCLVMFRQLPGFLVRIHHLAGRLVQDLAMRTMPRNIDPFASMLVVARVPGMLRLGVPTSEFLSVRTGLRLGI